MIGHLIDSISFQSWAGFSRFWMLCLFFEADLRCFHDTMAGTQVVKFPPGQLMF